MNEYQVPNFHAARIARIHQATLSLTVGREVDVQFRARAAGTRFAHHPEIIFLITIHDVDGRVESDRAEFFRPNIPSLLVEVRGVALGFVGLVNRGVETAGGEFPDLRDEFPGEVDRLAFEVIAEGPIPEHLEERVVVGVETDVFEVIVLTASADTLLGVRGPTGGIGALGLAEEDGHKLVHACVGEEQVRRVRHERRGLHHRVLLGGEEIEEGLAYLGGGHGSVNRWRKGVFNLLLERKERKD